MPACTASAQGVTLIDDMSATSGVGIKFAPAFVNSCGMTGSWFNFGGTIMPSPFAFSPLPAGIPADAGVMFPDGATTPGTDASGMDATGTDASGADATSGDAGDAALSDAVATGDASDAASDAPVTPAGPRAACMVGATGATAYATSGIGFNLAQVMNPDGGNALPATVDASSHTGIQFWAWGGPEIGASQSALVVLKDINQTFGFGPAGTKTATGQLCDGGTDGNGMAPTACGGDRVSQTINAGWQLVQVPFANFKPISGYSDGNGETKLDPSTLTQFQFQVQNGATPDAGVPFDICLYGISFY